MRSQADDPYVRYAADSEALTAIGACLRGLQPDDVAVLSAGLAALAVAAWTREEADTGRSDEAAQQWKLRDHAATLALIGLAVKQRGERDGDNVHVRLHHELVQAAIEAAQPTTL